MANEIPKRSREMVAKRDGQRCARCGILVLHGHWHHRRSRSVRDLLTHSPANGVWLCPADHSWVHGHPFEARAEGFIVSRYADPTETPLKHILFGWVLLSAEGGFQAIEPPEGGQ